MKCSKLLALALLANPFLISHLQATEISADITKTAALFSRSAEYSDVKYSPGGDYISAKTTNDGKHVLIILDAKTKKMVHAIQFGSNAQVGNYVWVNDERIVFEKEYLKGWEDHPQYYGELMAVNADGSRAEYLFGYDNNEQQVGSNIKKKTPYRGTAHILDGLKDDKRFMLVQAEPWGVYSKYSNKVAENRQVVFKVDVYKGSRTEITNAPISYSKFLIDHQGDVRLVQGIDKNSQRKSFYYKDGKWINIDDLNLGLNDFKPIAFTNDPNVIYAAGRINSQTLAVYTVNLETKQKSLIIKDDLVDPSQYWIDENTRELYAVEYESAYPSFAFVDPKNEQAETLKQLVNALPGQQIHLVSRTRDNTQWIIKASNDRNPGDYYAFDSKALKLNFLASTKEWVTPEQMAEVKPISFTARDGTQINGYLTLPNGKEAKNLPLVVTPHTGPHGVRDRWGYNSQNQMLASQGIAVLQVNYRGSTGYGAAFEVKGYKKWGTDIQYDIIDGTEYIVKQGIADKSRICITGDTFGGYSALQSATIEPNLFKCAVGFGGIYDLPLWKKSSDVADTSMGKTYQDVIIGDDHSQLIAISPAYNVDKLKAKLLLVHGGEDERAPIEQLESLEKALKAQNYPYQKMVMDDEGTGFYNDEHRAKYYGEMLSFLKTNLNL